MNIKSHMIKSDDNGVRKSLCGRTTSAPWTSNDLYETVDINQVDCQNCLRVYKSKGGKTNG
jgi:hypothetical protein